MIKKEFCVWKCFWIFSYILLCILGIVRLEDVSGKMLGFLPSRRLFPEAIWGPAGLEDMMPSVLIWEELQPAQYPHHFKIVCWLDTTSSTSSYQMLLSQFIRSIKTSAASNTRHDSNSLRSSQKMWTEITQTTVLTHIAKLEHIIFILKRTLLPHMLHSQRCTSCEMRCCHMFLMSWMNVLQICTRIPS